MLVATMTTKPKRWPDTAKWARDFSAEQIQEAEKILRPLLDNKDLVVAVRAGKALNNLQLALRALEQVGAPTRPYSQ